MGSGADNAGAGRWGVLVHGHHGQHLCRGAGNAGTLGVGVSPGGSVSWASGAFSHFRHHYFPEGWRFCLVLCLLPGWNILLGVWYSMAGCLPGIINGFL